MIIIIEKRRERAREREREEKNQPRNEKLQLFITTNASLYNVCGGGVGCG